MQRDELVEGCAQGINVSALVDHAAVGQCLLGAHVSQGAQDVAGDRQGRVGLETGEPEVGHPEVARVVDHEVRRLDVTVQHAVFVRVVERERRL